MRTRKLWLCSMVAILPLLAGCPIQQTPEASFGNGTGKSGASSGTVSAPEINPASAAAALTLLAGGICVIRGRRK